ncbi:TPA: Dot/Icm T4SS effector Ceg19 [Legionella pneumophila subsp. pneumophila]|uniref:Dot/Icm T4SS effector Ceg19 n=1 Tax=Legionella pneumophila TaxID=446 RepID=UPI00093201C8|nr:Dot/Icm T4SS effector Ceg19 [Legionella pneumophila]MDW8869521.1 Dot/Icm T4SS effector Ceg19 [Legionella pneumophila]MDW8915531.1 Dot/Icm T4SS effector Ceg19 [Legionella pneumophila]MDW8923863.1 Dot/Icm T4SS effector Ceg19 [Legionella pneumophila]MDW8930280.1 Dot/Icm T4SS effector Ceg19 [Legionella pneumophila]MDW8933712.1 Dot/Icm T4SS effector Ceg19 [Legionella pneumophila]
MFKKIITKLGIVMSKLRALEKEANELALILDQALLSQSIDVKKRALSQFENSELIQNKDNLRVFIDSEHPIVSLIRLATKILPEKIENLQKKVRLLEIQLAAETEETLDESNSDSESVDYDNGIDVETVVPVTVTHQEHVSEPDTRSVAIARLREVLKPYIDSTQERTYEHYYGMAGTLFSFFGAAGYSKTDKLNAITKLFQNLEGDGAEPLNDTDRDILTTGVLGTTLKPLLEDEHIGNELKDLLSIKTDNVNTI